MHIESGDTLCLTARALGRWVEEHAELLEGVVALRALGPGAAQAVREVLAVREVRRGRLSLELFLLLADERDAWRLLGSVLSAKQVSCLRIAVLGGDHYACDALEP